MNRASRVVHGVRGRMARFIRPLVGGVPRSRTQEQAKQDPESECRQEREESGERQTPYLTLGKHQPSG